MASTQPSSNPTESFEDLAKELFTASLAPSTRASYNIMTDTFEKFCLKYYDKLIIYPSNEKILSCFIAYLFSNDMKPATIYSHVSAISFKHKSMNFADPADSFVIKKILKGVKNLRNSNDTCLPITEEILVKIIGALDCVVSSYFHRTMLKAMFAIAFYAFFADR